MNHGLVQSEWHLLSCHINILTESKAFIPSEITEKQNFISKNTLLSYIPNIGQIYTSG